MYCPNCGKQIQQGSKFCIHCGAQIYAPNPQVTQQQPSTKPNPTPQPAPQKKKKTNWFASIIIMIIVIGIGKGIGAFVADLFLSDKTPDSNAGQSSYSDTTDTAHVPSAAFTDIFADRYIVRMDSLFIGMDSAAFAKVNDDGSIHCMEYGYKDDLVCSTVETAYFDISALTESEKAEFDTQIREQLSSATNLSFAQVTFNLGTNYYTLSIRLDDLDDPDTLQAAIDQGLLSVSGSSRSISMAESEKMLLADGYEKR